MSPQERKKREKENKKNSVLRAARRLFFENGFKSVTVDSIAAKAGISKGSIYLHFKSKEEIYAQILINDNVDFYKRLTTPSPEGTTAAQRLLDFARIYADYFINDRESFRIFIAFMLNADQMNFSEEQNTHLVKMGNDDTNVIGEIIKNGMAKGEFNSAINVRQAQNAIWGLLNGIISLYLFTGKEENRALKINTMVNEGLNIFISGLKK